jgi:hypothetical protein
MITARSEAVKLMEDRRKAVWERGVGLRRGSHKTRMKKEISTLRLGTEVGLPPLVHTRYKELRGCGDEAGPHI